MATFSTGLCEICYGDGYKTKKLYVKREGDFLLIGRWNYEEEDWGDKDYDMEVVSWTSTTDEGDDDEILYTLELERCYRKFKIYKGEGQTDYRNSEYVVLSKCLNDGYDEDPIPIYKEDDHYEHDEPCKETQVNIILNDAIGVTRPDKFDKLHPQFIQMMENDYDQFHFIENNEISAWLLRE
jgi:hypothetical protein